MVTPTDVSQYLNELRFPATREEIVEFAEENDAPDYVVEAVAGIPDDVYDNLAQVWSIMGEP